MGTICKDIWSPYIGKDLTQQHEDGNTLDRRGVSDEGKLCCGAHA